MKTFMESWRVSDSIGNLKARFIYCKLLEADQTLFPEQRCFFFVIDRILAFLIQHYCQICGPVVTEWNVAYSVSICVNTQPNLEVSNREIIAFHRYGKNC